LIQKSSVEVEGPASVTKSSVINCHVGDRFTPAVMISPSFAPVAITYLATLSLAIPLWLADRTQAEKRYLIPAAVTLRTQSGLSFRPKLAVVGAVPVSCAAKPPSYPPATRETVVDAWGPQPLVFTSKEGFPTRFGESATVIGTEAEPVLPSLSVTVTVAVQLPAR
jgi:hypothetical protein